GTLTDGKIYMGDTKEILKAFDVKDGCGIKEILPQFGILPVIITARSSRILENRCRELDIQELHQGVRNKIEEMEKIISDYSEKDKCNYSLENVAYMGDDILDIQCMKPVKEAGGLAACPLDAVKSVVDIADFICTRKSGEGAVREFIEWLTAMKSCSGEGFEKVKAVSHVAYDFIINFCPSRNPDGRYELEGGVYANVMTYVTKNVGLTSYETHKRYIDIQYLIYGTELMITHPAADLKDFIYSAYNEEKDITLYNYNLGEVTILCPGDTIVLYPNDAHRGAIAHTHSMKIRKIVVKVPIDI
ncbi:MAG: YhcH/YjgK/YiaL family protein, partial [Lachnospiraceae bacterium]